MYNRNTRDVSLKFLSFIQEELNIWTVWKIQKESEQYA